MININSNFNRIKKKVFINYNKIDIIDKDTNQDDEDNDIMSHLNYRKLEEIKKDFMKNEE